MIKIRPLRTLCRLMVLVLIIAASAAAHADGLSTLPVKKINGKEYYCYQVQPKETLYSLQHKLGVDREVIVRYNPSAQDGLQANAMLYFPVELAPRISTSAPAPAQAESSPKAATASEARYHTVAKGESLYGIARDNGLTLDQISKLNPQAADGIRPGQKLLIAPAEEPQNTSKRTYKLAEGETLYGVAKRHNLTVEQLLDANPGLSPVYYKGGQVIVLPETQVVSTTPAPEQDTAQTAAPEPAPAHETIAVPAVVIDEPEPPVPDNKPAGAPTVAAANENATASIAVILPFMLSERKPGKAAQRYTDFYKGLLIAVDSTAVKGRPTAIYAYDSANSTDTVSAILRRPELTKVNAIIAPPDEIGLSMVADFGRRNNITVINPFVIRDESYRENDVMMQMNIPSAAMQRRAVQAIVSEFGDRKPVILHREGAPEEQSEIAAALIEAYQLNGIDPITITFSGDLKGSDLMVLARHPNEQFLFVPLDSKAAEVKHFLDPIVELRENLNDQSKVMLMGYPEWITFRGDNLKKLHRANTVVYSRFFADPDSPAVRHANDQFKYWYGTTPEATFPNQGLLGLDLGMYLIEGLRRNDGDFSLPTPSLDGVQNCFRLSEQPDAEGLVNDVIYLINFRPSGWIDRRTF